MVNDEGHKAVLNKRGIPWPSWVHPQHLEDWQRMEVKVVGDSPLIMNAWTMKAIEQIQRRIGCFGHKH